MPKQITAIEPHTASVSPSAATTAEKRSGAEARAEG